MTNTVPVAAITAKVARQKGLEPLAYCLEGSCSILLSYRHLFRPDTRRFRPFVAKGPVDTGIA